MIEPRVYRAAFIPALIATVVAMFSLQSRPRPLPQGLAADVLFDGAQAADAARQLAERHPDRRAGTVGDRETAGLVASTLDRRGFAVQRQRFAAGGDVLENVVGRRAGRSRRQIVVIAPRDASSVPDLAGSAADTAALLELSRVIAGRPSRKTLVLASVDGSARGELGTRELAERLGEPGLVDGVLVMSDLATKRRRGSSIVAWANDASRAGIGLQRTAADSLRQELDEAGGSTSAAGQLARLSFPIGIGGQGVLLEHGYDSVRISGSGELPPKDPPRELNEDRLGGLGRTTLRTFTALDLGRTPERGPHSYVIAVSQVMPGWVIALFAFALLVPALVASVDAFARARRRREPIARWLRWLATWIAPFLAALALAELLALAGATPEPPPAPVAPSENPLDSAAVIVLAAVALAVVGVRAALRFLVLRPQPALASPVAPGAACAVALGTSGSVLVLWFVNPYAALVLVPAAHLWMLATLVDPPPPRRAGLLLVAGGLLPPVLVAVYYLLRLSMDPLTGAWYLLLLVTGHGMGLITALLGCVMLGTLAATISIARAREPRPEAPADDRPAVYGPGTYAGPGALGGTESALRR